MYHERELSAELKAALTALWEKFGPAWFRKKDAKEFGIESRTVTALVGEQHVMVGYQGFRIMRTADGQDVPKQPTR